ncbi:MAG: radical SAM protein, partial [Paludibacteraceae bacterium]|nr:radical SAM protein [Paludibacteraceae bacterium]
MTRYLANRAINFLRAETDWILRKIGIKHFKHFPTFLSIEPANFCQLRCPQCPVGQSGGGKHPHALMPLELYRKLLKETCKWIHTIQFFFQGEPLLNPHLPEMIHEARKRHIYTIVSTNAQSLTPSLAHKLIAAGLNRIIVSVDGLTEESYAAYRKGGNLLRALDGLKYLREAKTELRQHTTIELQCLLLKSNEHEWDIFRRNYKKLGADRLTFKTAQFYDYADGNPL